MHNSCDTVLLAHPGTQYSFKLADQLQMHGRLLEFHTGFGFTKNSVLAKAVGLLPTRLRAHAEHRKLEAVPEYKLVWQPLKEIWTFLGYRKPGGMTESELHERNRLFQISIPDWRLERSRVVIGFDTSSWILGQRAKAHGKKFILDQSIGDPIVKELAFEELRRRFPAWSFSLPRKAEAHLLEESLERRLADRIVVPSAFVKSTLIQDGVPESKIRVIPFGTDLDFFFPASKAPRDKIAFLFAGSLSARKGVPVLLEAWNIVQPKDAELWLAGSGNIPQNLTIPNSIKLLGMMSRSEIARLMREADAFLFPSFFEGLAQVQVEALASGLPVIGTRESGAEDIITEGKNGFIVAAGDISAIAERIRLLAADRSLLGSMQKNAVANRGTLSWRVYGDRWARLLDEFGACS